jgi:hypothetical protein
MYTVFLIILRGVYPQGNGSVELGRVKVIAFIGFWAIDAIQIHFSLIEVDYMHSILIRPRGSKRNE